MKKFNVKKVFIPAMSILVAATPILVSTQVSKNTTSLIDVSNHNFSQINLMSELVSEETGQIKKLDENSAKEFFGNISNQQNEFFIVRNDYKIDKQKNIDYKKVAEYFNYLTDEKTTETERWNFIKTNLGEDKYKLLVKEMTDQKEKIYGKENDSESRRVGIAIDENGKLLFEKTPEYIAWAKTHNEFPLNFKDKDFLNALNNHLLASKNPLVKNNIDKGYLDFMGKTFEGGKIYFKLLSTIATGASFISYFLGGIGPLVGFVSAGVSIVYSGIASVFETLENVCKNVSKNLISKESLTINLYTLISFFGDAFSKMVTLDEISKSLIGWFGGIVTFVSFTYQLQDLYNDIRNFIFSYVS